MASATSHPSPAVRLLCRRPPRWSPLLGPPSLPWRSCPARTPRSLRAPCLRPLSLAARVFGTARAVATHHRHPVHTCRVVRSRAAGPRLRTWQTCPRALTPTCRLPCPTAASSSAVRSTAQRPSAWARSRLSRQRRGALRCHALSLCQRLMHGLQLLAQPSTCAHHAATSPAASALGVQGISSPASRNTPTHAPKPGAAQRMHALPGQATGQQRLAGRGHTRICLPACCPPATRVAALS